MGIGMILIVAPEDAETAIATLAKAGEQAHQIGQIQSGDKTKVILK